jgi:hypothetical protein
MLINNTPMFKRVCAKQANVFIGVPVIHNSLLLSNINQTIGAKSICENEVW